MSADYRVVTTLLRTGRVVVLALALAVVPAADATAKPRHKTKRAKTTKVAKKKRQTAKRAATPVPAATPTPEPPAPVATPVVSSVISIGGYVFYNLTMAEAFDAYLAAVAAAPAGYSPPPATSISVTTTVGGSVS